MYLDHEGDGVEPYIYHIARKKITMSFIWSIRKLNMVLRYPSRLILIRNAYIYIYMPVSFYTRQLSAQIQNTCLYF